MKENKLPKRKNLRIYKYNYSKIGAYFITMCVKDRKCILSKIEFDEIPHIILLNAGKTVEKYIKSINNTYDFLNIDNYIIMPNHIHIICVINNYKNNGSISPTTPTNFTIPFLISTLKRFTQKDCLQLSWQRNYYEHIIRNEFEYLKILEYIKYNPFNWRKDKYFKI